LALQADIISTFKHRSINTILRCYAMLDNVWINIPFNKDDESTVPKSNPVSAEGTMMTTGTTTAAYRPDSLNYLT